MMGAFISYCFRGNKCDTESRPIIIKRKDNYITSNSERFSSIDYDDEHIYCVEEYHRFADNN